MRLGIWEIVLILIVAMLFFGPNRLSELGPALGRSVRGFKKGIQGDDEPPKPLPPPDDKKLTADEKKTTPGGGLQG